MRKVLTKFGMTAIALTQFLAPVRAEEIVSPGGSAIHRYGAPKSFEAAAHSGRYLDEISAHLESMFGDKYYVLNENVSDKIRLDVLVFPPSSSRDTWVLVTAGMSDLPMSVPEDLENSEAYRFAEMAITLPGNWFDTDGNNRIREDQLWDDTRYWPVGHMKALGRFPHNYETWLHYWHTIPNGVPANPLAENTRLNGFLLLPPFSWPDEKLSLTAGDGNKITFLAIYPLYEEEMQFKLDQGVDALIDLFAAAGVTELVQIDRPNVMDFLQEGGSSQ